MTERISWSLAPADSSTFTGRAWTALLGGAEAEDPIRIYFVRFAAGARTNWHRHSGTQLLVVVSGRCVYQREGEPVREIGPGESTRFEPGERHWHGAGDAEGTEHLAVNLANASTEWMEPAPGASQGGVVEP